MLLYIVYIVILLYNGYCSVTKRLNHNKKIFVLLKYLKSKTANSCMPDHIISRVCFSFYFNFLDVKCSIAQCYSIYQIARAQLPETSVRAGPVLKAQAMTDVSYNHTHHPPFHLNTPKVRLSFASTAILHQIYFHWSRVKIKAGPPCPPTSSRQPQANPIKARYFQ